MVAASARWQAAGVSPDQRLKERRKLVLSVKFSCLATCSVL